MLHDQNGLNRLGKAMLDGKANCISLFSYTKKYHVYSVISLYHTTFKSCTIYTLG